MAAVDADTCIKIFAFVVNSISSKKKKIEEKNSQVNIQFLIHLFLLGLQQFDDKEFCENIQQIKDLLNLYLTDLSWLPLPCLAGKFC